MEFAAEIFALLRCHWYVNGKVPAATTENVAGCPTFTVTFIGCVDIVGAVLCGCVGGGVDVGLLLPHPPAAQAHASIALRSSDLAFDLTRGPPACSDEPTNIILILRKWFSPCTKAQFRDSYTKPAQSHHTG